jgi:hypothetical protein
VTTREALQAWAAKTLLPAVVAATSEGPSFNPTEEGCRFCAAAGVCRALQQHAIEIAQKEFDVPALERLTLEEVSGLLAKADLIEAALKAIREHGTKLLSLGQKVPGWKLVEGRKNRAWRAGIENTVIDNAHMLGFDLDKVAPRKLCSPAQAEKLGLSQLVEGFAEKPRGAAVLAPESDKRPALAPDFDVMDAGHLLD